MEWRDSQKASGNPVVIHAARLSLHRPDRLLCHHAGTGLVNDQTDGCFRHAEQS
jgi:hypothetical protein